MTNGKVEILLALIDLHGGTGTFCRNLASGLRRFHPDEFAVRVLLLRDRGMHDADRSAFHSLDVIGAEVHEDWRRFYETPWHAWLIHRRVASSSAQIILTVGTYMNLLVPVVAQGRRAILSAHSPSISLHHDSRYPTITRMLMRWRYPRNLIVGPADGVIHDLVDNFGARRTCKIPHGVDLELIESLAQEPASDLPAQRPYIVACGRLSAAKDYPTLIRAYADAARHGLALDLIILGDGEERGRLTSLVRALGLADRVHFLGHRDNPFPYMKRATFYVLSSIFEGFGYSLLEAMVLGLPVIATNCPTGPAEILDHGASGILVAPQNVTSLSEAMGRLAADAGLRADMAAKARRRAEQLSIRRMAEAYRDLFRRTLNDCRR